MSPLKVDFYLLGEEAEKARFIFSCRLAEKAYRLQRSLFVFCENRLTAETLDELLWTFRENSFIPHNLQGEGPEPPPPIQIGYQGEPRGYQDILLNLSPSIPPFYRRFQRIMEIIPNNDDAKEKGRTRFKVYREAGAVIETHSIESVLL